MFILSQLCDAGERDQLAGERDSLIKRQEHLSSLAQLAERTVAEADEVAANIKEKATSEAENAAKAIIASAEEGGEMQYEFKRATPVAGAAALDFVRRSDAPAGLITDAR